MIPDSGYPWASSPFNTKRMVYLPDPADVEGKVVEVQAIDYSNSSGSPVVGCVVNDAFAFDLYIDHYDNSKIVCPQTGYDNYDTMSPGDTRRYGSIKCYKNSNTPRSLWYRLTI